MQHFLFTKASLGGRPATFIFLVENRMFLGFVRGQAYVCAGARPILPHWEEAHEFHVGHSGSRTAVVKVRMAPPGLAWRTGDPKGEEEPWTHANLVCGIGGFTVHSGDPGLGCLHEMGVRH